MGKCEQIGSWYSDHEFILFFRATLNTNIFKFHIQGLPEAHKGVMCQMKIMRLSVHDSI